MHENFTRENREVPSAPDTTLCAGRLEKDVIQKSNMHADGKSDGRVLPTKCPNKCGNSQAEGTEAALQKWNGYMVKVARRTLTACPSFLLLAHRASRSTHRSSSR